LGVESPVAFGDSDVVSTCTHHLRGGLIRFRRFATDWIQSRDSARNTRSSFQLRGRASTWIARCKSSRLGSLLRNKRLISDTETPWESWLTNSIDDPALTSPSSATEK